MNDETAGEACGCGETTEGYLFICPKHYGMMLENSDIDYGLITTKD